MTHNPCQRKPKQKISAVAKEDALQPIQIQFLLQCWPSSHPRSMISILF